MNDQRNDRSDRRPRAAPSSNPVEQLAHRLDAIEQDVEVMVDAVHKLARVSLPDDDPKEPRVRFKDVIWACARCDSRLGIYNKEEDVITVKRGQVLLYATGGTLKVCCHNCGYMNVTSQAEQSILDAPLSGVVRGT